MAIPVHPRFARFAAIVLANVAMMGAVTGCHAPKTATQSSTETSKTAGDAPLAFARTTPDAQVSLSLPEPIKQYPDLHKRLYDDGETTLTAFMSQAGKDRAEQSADGFPVPAYYQKIEWKISAQSPRLLSLYAEQNDFEGGAHPNTAFRTLLWDKDKNALIPVAELFAGDVDMAPVDAFVCHQIEAQRSKRAGAPVSQAASGFSCPKFTDSKLVLIPSTQPGKIGAIDALYAPYEVGPYAEGPYEIRVPQGQLKGLISAAYADQFAGDATTDTTTFADPDADKDQAPQ